MRRVEQKIAKEAKKSVVRWSGSQADGEIAGGWEVWVAGWACVE